MLLLEIVMVVVGWSLVSFFMYIYIFFMYGIGIFLCIFVSILFYLRIY